MPFDTIKFRNTSALSLTFNPVSLYVLVDSVDFLKDPLAPQLDRLIHQLISASVDFVQLRDKRLNDRQNVELGKRIARLTQGSGTRFIMNDRVDLAIASNADGVHLGQEDLRIGDARLIFGQNKIIGISTHSIVQAREAIVHGADYVAVGPVFHSTTKAFDQFVGTGLLANVAKEGISPAFAIGGISCSNVERVVAAGVRRIAVSSAVTEDPDPQSAASELLRKLRSF